MKRNKKLKNLKLRISGLEDCLIAQDNVIDSYRLRLAYHDEVIAQMTEEGMCYSDEIRKLNVVIKSMRERIISLTSEILHLRGQMK